MLAFFGFRSKAKAVEATGMDNVMTFTPMPGEYKEPAMFVVLGEEGLKHSWQRPFPPMTPCVHCDGEARIGFVASETAPSRGPHVCSLHQNDYHGGNAWLHDSCAVAVYFCRKCLDVTALYNQA
jgi:hypothetical protein